MNDTYTYFHCRNMGLSYLWHLAIDLLVNILLNFLKNFKLIFNFFFEIFTALYHAGQYEDCLKDIELALKYRYPKNLEYKLHQRRGQCLTQIGQHLEARNAFNQAMSALDLVKNIK